MLACMLFAVGLMAGAGIGLALPDVAQALGLKREGPSISLPVAPGPQLANAGALPLPRVIEPANAVEPAFLLAEPLRHRKSDLGALRMAAVSGGSGAADPAAPAFIEDDIPAGELVTGAIDAAHAAPASPAPATRPMPQDIRPSETRQAALAAPADRPEPVLSAHAPRISIILDDLGQSTAAARRIIAMPREVTLSFLPYGAATPRLAAEAREQGHEVMLHLPMEPLGEADPGPGALTMGMEPAQIEAAVRKNLSAFSGYTGVNNHMGSRFTEDVRALIPVMRVLKEQGLFFVDSRTSERSRAASVGAMAGVPALTRDVFLDHASGPDHLLHQLTRLEERAREQGHAVAIAHPHDLTLEMLEVWLRSLPEKGIRLVPVSAQLERAEAKG